MRSFMFSMKILFLLIVLQTLFSSTLTAQDNQPIGDYGGNEDTYERFNEKFFERATESVDWKVFPIADKAFFPLPNSHLIANAEFESFNKSIDATPPNGCLQTEGQPPVKYSDLYHLADDVFSEADSEVINPLTGQIIHHNLREYNSNLNNGGGFPGDSVIVMHKLPNGKPIFSMLGHLRHGSRSNLLYSDPNSNPRYISSKLLAYNYLLGGENLYAVSESTGDISNVLVYNWSGNTHIHWELRYFPTNVESKRGEVTVNQYPKHPRCGFDVGVGYMQPSEHDGLKPSQLGWYHPSQFLLDFNAGKYGRPIDGPRKQIDGITLCNRVNQCSLLPADLNLDQLLIKDLDKVLIPDGYYLELTETNGKVFCLDSDADNARSYKYPDTDSLVETDTQTAFIRKGDCTNPNGELKKSHYLDGAGLFPRVWHCDKLDHPIVGVVGTNGEKFCYSVRIGPQWIKRQGYTLGFPVKRLELYGDAPVQIYDKDNNCRLLKEDTDFTGTEAFYRMVIMKDEDKDVQECQEYSEMDYPVVQYISQFEGNGNLPPKLVWKTSKSPSAPEYNQYLYVLVPDRADQIITWKLIPRDVNEMYLPDYGPGLYHFFLVNFPVDVIPSVMVDYTWWNDYKITTTDNPVYVGFELSQQIYSFNVPEGVDLTIPPGQIGHLWGDSFNINGFPYGNVMSPRTAHNAISATNPNYIFRLNPGTYNISHWNNGAVEIGTDYVGTYGEYLALTNAEVLSETWESVAYEDYVATPTPTSTPTSTPTATETAIPAHTPTWTQTPTSVPTDTPTETSTSTSTPTLTPMPSNTLTPTATETPSATQVPTDTAVPTTEATVVLTPTPTNTPLITATSTPTITPLLTPIVVIESERIYLPLIMR